MLTHVKRRTFPASRSEHTHDFGVESFLPDYNHLSERLTPPVDSSKHTASPLGGIYEAARSPSDTFPYTNCLAVHPSDFPQELVHVLVNGFPLTVRHESLDNRGQLREGFVGVSLSQRQWIGIEIGAQVTVGVLPDPPDPNAPSLVQAIEIEVDFLKPGYESPEEYSLHDMATTFVDDFKRIQMTEGQPIVFMYRKQKLRGLIKSMTLVEELPPARKITGVISTETSATFSKLPDSTMKAKLGVKRDIFDFKLEDSGIGGLDAQCSDIIRRVLASRVFPEVAKKLGIQHVKGLVLYGPSGTGKTLLAHQIASSGLLNTARKPKIVSGPEILSGSSEVIPTFFLDAEAEYKERGDSSELHTLFLDELDAICKKRGSNSSSNVGDNIVSQLLSKLDGVKQLNNILVIGTTNRIEMIDAALLRPGRLEVQMEIALPDENSRLQILEIHTTEMQKNGMMGDDVDLSDLARLTRNFSGADIMGLVKSATSFALTRHIKFGSLTSPDSYQGPQVNKQDFEDALRRDVNPAPGVPTGELHDANSDTTKKGSENLVGRAKNIRIHRGLFPVLTGSSSLSGENAALFSDISTLEIDGGIFPVGSAEDIKDVLTHVSKVANENDIVFYKAMQQAEASHI